MSIKNIIKKIKKRIMMSKDPVAYAKNIGVNVLGENNRFLSCNFGSEPWLITIGSHVCISGNVTFLTHDGSTWCFREQEGYKHIIKFGAITIKDNCFIGHSSIIMPGVTIGENSIVGAGAVVTKDVPSNSVVAGVPAKVLCTSDEYAEKLLKNTPDYDIEAYKKDEKSEILRMLGLDH